MAQADYFLKIEGIEGGAVDDKHKGEIDIQSFSWGLSQTGGFGTGGGGRAGKVSLQDFHFVAKTGIQSPVLMQATATGQHFKKATLTVRKSGERQFDEYLKIELEQVLVSSYQIGGTDIGDDALPHDQVSLNFQKIVMQVTPEGVDGAPGPPVTASYDVKASVK